VIVTDASHEGTAKNEFQVHGIDAVEKVVFRSTSGSQVLPLFKALLPCLIGLRIGACWPSLNGPGLAPCATKTRNGSAYARPASEPIDGAKAYCRPASALSA
jgi:hypothetical protein